MKKTVIVLGTWSSGSGAVCDYLSSRVDFINPFDANEFKIISDPMGLHHLRNNCYQKKNLLYSTHAFQIFEEYIEKVEKYKVFSSFGIKKKLYDRKLISSSKNFLKSITKFKYYGLPHYKDVTLSFKQKIIYKLKKKILKKNIPDCKVLSIVTPVSEVKFLKEAKKFINIILNNKIGSKKNFKYIVINNGADILDPIRSTQYYTNPKIICVLRDPRDIFCGMKLRQAKSTPWYDVRIFVKWYKYNFGNRHFKNLLKHNKILIIKFENFVLNFNQEKKRISNFLKIKNLNNLKSNSNNNFDIKFSKDNVFKSKKFLTRKENQIITKELREYLQW